MRIGGRVLTILLLSVGGLGGAERQQHGFDFEQEVWNHLFQRGYTDEWDIPGYANLNRPGIPVSIKYIRWGSSVYLGDAIRQRAIEEPFELVVGFHETVEGEKETVAIFDLFFTPEEWNGYWGDVTVEELEAFAERIQKGTVAEAQAYARKHAAELRKRSGVFSINPKINEDQRRIQCSVPFTVFFEEWVGEEPARQEVIELWGREFRGF